MNTGRMLNKVVVLFAMMLLPVALHAQPCDRLSQLGSPAGSITLATIVDTGNFTSVGSANALHNLPPFCRVAADLRPTPDSVIRIEVWLPTAQWNGKFIAVGSGGWGGSLSYGEMADALRRGYATSATDDGHTGPSASFVVGHPENLSTSPIALSMR
jgi:feruloyl esterase